jgi:hypothetical protein
MKLKLIIIIVFIILIPSACFSLRINEVCSSNTSLISDYLNRYSDWIEIKNNSTVTIDLNLYCLSDSPANLRKFRFPAGMIMAPGQIILVWAVNEPTVIDPNGEICGTNFAISSLGEPVFLSLYAGPTIIDQMPNIPIPENVSYGRVDDGTSWFYFTQPTPRQENTTPGYNTLLLDPVASQTSGYFATSATINFSTIQPGAQIHYTTDGSVPSETSPVWSGPMTLYDRSTEPNNISLIPTVLPNLPPPVNELDWWFPPASNLPKIHTFRARCYADGALPSNTITRTYMVGISLYDLPIVSVVMDSTDLFDPDTGIYVAGNGYDGDHFLTANFMQNWERPVVADWFNATGNLVYQKQCDVEIHGNYTARAGMKSLRFNTPDNVANYINYPFFGTDYLSSFRYLILRNSGNDVHKTLFRDNFMQNLMKEQSLDVARFAPYIVFLNGECWGIHNLQERMDEYFIAGHYNIPIAELDVLECNQLELCGDNQDYTSLLNYMELNDETNPAVWQYLETRIDMKNFREYIAGIVYMGNTDWPDNNVRYWRKRIPYTTGTPYGHDGRWRWLIYDMDFSFGLYQDPYWIHDTLGRALEDSLGWRTIVLRNLIQNDGFKKDFINTIADRLNYNWQPSKVNELINQYENAFVTSIPQHIERWCMPSTIEMWHGEVNALRIFAANRPAFLRNQVVNQFGLAGTANVTLQIQPPEGGIVRVNDTVDLSSGDYIYFQGIPISMQAIPNQGWEIVSFGGQQTDSLAFNPTVNQTIQLVLQETVSNDDEAIPTVDLWSFQVSPNPVQKNSSYLHIKFLGKGYKNTNNLLLAIYNVKGQQVVLQKVPTSALETGEMSAEIKGISSGIYIINLIEKKTTKAVHKFIIK